MPSKKTKKPAVTPSEPAQSPSLDVPIKNADLRDVAIEVLREHPENPRRGDVAAVVASIKANGFYGTLVVQKSTMRVLAGNHRLRAAQQVGMKLVPCAIIDVDDAAALRILLADNRTSDLASYDDKSLADALAKLAGDFAGTGYRQRDLDELLRRMVAPAPPPTDLAYLGAAIVEEAMRHFRIVGFPYPRIPVFVGMQDINSLRASDDDSLLRSMTGYRLADSYHHHRYAVKIEGKVDPVSAFDDDKKLRKAFEVELLGGRRVVEHTLPSLFTITNNVQAASNFRPAFALWLLRRFCPSGGTWLDTSTGFGGRLVGFLASNAGRYVGIDPAKLTHDGNIRLAEDYGAASRVQLGNKPAEDVDVDEVGGEESCDFAFTSPPYFTKEHYTDEATQSWMRYGGSSAAWVDGFLKPTMALQFAALKPGSWSVMNIDDVIIDGAKHPLAAETIRVGEEVGFTFVRRESLPLPSGAPVTGAEVDRDEPVLVFRKP